MESLLFKEMMILSKTQKAARRVRLIQGRNVILGENDVGKSTLIKSFYHALGADTPQLNNARWKNANPIYALKFSIKGSDFAILRDGKFFGLFDGNNNLIGRCQGISGDKGIAHLINKLLGFNIKLESSDGKMRMLGPAYYFLPYYVDQDEGWKAPWSSFKGLQAIKKYKKHMLDYHLGLKPQAVYDALSEMHELNRKIDAVSAEKDTLITVRDDYVKRKASRSVNISPEAFLPEIEMLVEKYNGFLGKQQEQLQSIKEERNKKLQIEQEISVLEAAIVELDSDYKFAVSPKTHDVIDCPTCGTEFDNSISERFSILDDVDYCRNLIDQRKKDHILACEKITALEADYGMLAEEAYSLKSLLDIRKNDVTFSELIASEGYKDILSSIGNDISALDDKQADIEGELIDIKPRSKVDSKRRKEIPEFYKSKMKESLNSLNVAVLREEDYATPYKVIKENALGSDLPRALLAQYFSYLHTMSKCNSFVACPFVIDSPLQQEQDEDNANAIFDFILSNTLAGQQLVLGTLTLEGYPIDDELLGKCHLINLEGKFGLLQQDQYDDVYNEISGLHEKTLEVDA